MKFIFYGKRVNRTALAACFLAFNGFIARISAQSVELKPQTQSREVWKDAIGSAFTKGTLQTGFSVAAGFGSASFGSSVAHDLALSSVSVGWICTDTVAPERWFKGNFEILGELFGGAQVNPETRYLVGLTPLLRYNFATDSRWIPFLTCGAGIAFTDIGYADLSGTFQFDPQGGLGMHYFVRTDLAVTIEWRWLHLSNAGIKEPNRGVNSQLLQAGLSWFF